jgi:hypothetical protein
MRVHFYPVAKRVIWNKACLPESEGGFPGFFDSEGKLRISFASFENLLPANIRRLTESQKQMCGCKICIDCNNMIKSLNEWQNAHLKWFEELLAKKTPDSAEYKKVKESMNKFIAKVFKAHVWSTMKDAMQSMTCLPVGDNLPFFPYKCCLKGRCEDCSNRSL